jgi:ABC-type transport system substrate-binding protein
MDKLENTELSRRQLLYSGAFVMASATLPSVFGATSSHAAVNPKPRAAKIKNLTFAQSVQINSLATMGTQPTVYPAGYEAAFAIYRGLVRFKNNLAIEPDLATGWETSSDGTKWTFSLRKGVKFHDGTPFNADVVVAYFTKMIDRTYNVSAFGLWSPITSTKKIGEFEVEVTTAKPYGALLNTLAHGSGLIPSLSLIEKGAAEAATKPIGTGPYQVDKFEPGTKLVVKSFKDYVGPNKPVYDTITFVFIGDATARMAALESGQVNLVDAVPAQDVARLGASSNVNVVNIPGLQVFGVGLNFNNPILQKLQVRQALNLAVDVQSITASLFRGYATPLTSPLAPKTNGYATAGPNKYDPQAAISLLKRAGLTLDKDQMFNFNGKPVSFKLQVPDGLYPNDLLVAAAIQDQLKKVGIDVTIKKIDKAAYWDSIRVARADVDFDLALFGFNPSHGSGALQLDIMYRSNATNGKVTGWNFSWYNNPKVDAMLTRSLEAVSPAAKKQVLADVGRQIWRDAPYIWLYVRNNLSAYDDKAATPLVLPVVFTLPSRPAK